MTSLPHHDARPTARYVMVGGFLGAGKTTAVERLARELVRRGLRVGLITNDQSSGLVDTAILRSRGFAVEEIAGGCFCCRFDSLHDAAERLTEDARPDVFVAEPVGSCTDLLATVSYPLRRMYGDRFSIAPLSVLVDPERARRVLGLARGRAFSPKVVYVYKKQLEEADLLVVNKCDTLADRARDELVSALGREFPGKPIVCIAAKTGDGLEDWFARVLDEGAAERATIELDYDRYADGEARLGWLNATLAVTADTPFDANELLLRLCERMRAAVAARGSEIAHLKMTLDGRDAAGQLAVVSVVGSDAEPDLREALLERCDGGSLILNLRAEDDPEALSALALAAFAAEREHGIALTVEHEERFRPARPVPTHRVSVSAP